MFDISGWNIGFNPERTPVDESLEIVDRPEAHAARTLDDFASPRPVDAESCGLTTRRLVDLFPIGFLTAFRFPLRFFPALQSQL